LTGITLDANADIINDYITNHKPWLTSGHTMTPNTIAGSDASGNAKEYAIPTNQQITLLASGWTAGAQSVTVAGVTTTNEIWWDASTLADSILAGQANLFCSSQTTDSLTFQCSNTPSSDININVIIR